MSISPAVQAAVDEIHRDRDALSAARKANDLLASQLSDQAGQVADLKSQVSALKVGAPLSDDDKKALLDAVNGVGDAVNEAGETTDKLATAVPANVDTTSAPAAPAQGGIIAPTPPPNDASAARPDPIAGTGQNGTVPLMPNLAFDPAGGVNHGPGDAGQPNQPPAIQTAGGFVVSGGGSTARAPGSLPESPSSSVVIPTDPDAKAPASTADEVKSGLGDSSQNATIGNDLKPVVDGPGIPQEPSPQAADAAQKQQDALAAEQEARRANPLNLSPDDLAKQQQADAGKGTAGDPAKVDPAVANVGTGQGSGQVPASPVS